MKLKFRGGFVGDSSLLFKPQAIFGRHLAPLGGNTRHIPAKVELKSIESCHTFNISLTKIDVCLLHKLIALVHSFWLMHLEQILLLSSKYTTIADTR